MLDRHLEALPLMHKAFGAKKGCALRFDAKDIPEEHAYVAWIDIMGASSWMHRSLSESSSVLGKFHTALLNAYYASREENPSSADVAVHAMTDGAYIVTHSPQRMREILETTMRSLARAFLESSKSQRFMVRSAVAAGTVVLGAAMMDRFSRNPNYSNVNSDIVKNVVLGGPFEVSNHKEREAPPFGVLVDKSAIGPESFSSGNLWRWWSRGQSLHDEFSRAFYGNVADYLDRLRQMYYTYGVTAQKISEYMAKAENYFIAEE